MYLLSVYDIIMTEKNLTRGSTMTENTPTYRREILNNSLVAGETISGLFVYKNIISENTDKI